MGNNTRAHALLLSILVLCATPAYASTLSGTVYNQDLEIARYAILLVEGTPPQRMILPNGTYNITLPAGTYQIQALQSKGEVVYSDETQVTVVEETDTTYDFILFPDDTGSTEDLPDASDLTFEEQTQNSGGIALAAAIIAVIAAAIVIFIIARQRKEQRKTATHTTAEDGQQTTAPQTMPELAADLESILKALKDEGGRTTQKELRKHIPCSEAKMSMMLTELEAKKRIERIKKGRGNLIVLKK